MKPLVSYYGGKQRLASRIVEVINRIPHTVYVEPFCGGAAVLFAKGRPEVTNNAAYREVINDLDDRLITLYRVAREQPNELHRWIELTPYSQAEHRKSAEILRNPAEHSDLERAWAYYTNSQQSFANELFCGWGARTLSESGAATWLAKQQRLANCFFRLADVHISSEDAIACINRWDSPHSLFYVDPPYPGTNLGHYKGYTLEDWERLCQCLDGIQGSYILSNYPQTVEPKSAQERIEIQAVCSASGAGKVGRRNQRHQKATAEELGDRTRTEVLWVCDRSHNARAELQKLMNHRQLGLFQGGIA